MKKILLIMWIIIIFGGLFLANKPSAPDQINSDPNIQIEDSTSSNPPTNLNYSQLLIDINQQLEDGYLTKAISLLKSAVKINPNSPEPLFKLGNAFLKNGQALEAKAAFESAIKLNPRSINSQIALARAHFALRQIDEAQEIILSLDQENQKVKYYRAIIFVLAKQYEDAKNLFSQIADQNSQKFLSALNTYALYKEAPPLFEQMLLAKVLSDVEEYYAAIPYLFDILNQKNDYRDAWLVLGYAYLNINKIPDAIDALLQARALNPNQPQTLFYLGLAYFANNDIDTAIKYLESADNAGYEPKEQLQLKLGDLYLLQEKYQKSAENYEKVLNANHGNLDVFVRYIWLEIDQINQPKKALDFALIALKEHPNEIMSYNLVGWAYTAIGDYENGKLYLDKALSMNSKFDAAILNIGWLYEKKGMTKLAMDYYKKAYILGKGNSIGNLAAIRFNKIKIDSSIPKT